MSEYDCVQRGSLKLKGVSDHGVKKKKKKKKKKKEDKLRERLEQIKNAGDASASASDGEGATSSNTVEKRTKAELAFERIKQQRNEEQILDKASKTHKERIMEFNGHLDTLTEHFDIPKVSWTK